jgi:hypothetical protein
MFKLITDDSDIFQLPKIDTDILEFNMIQKNLEEAVHFMERSGERDDVFRMVIKPIKINSPVEKLVCEYATDMGTAPRSKVRKTIFERESMLQKTVSPRRRISIVSIDCVSDQTLVT